MRVVCASCVHACVWCACVCLVCVRGKKKGEGGGVIVGVLLLHGVMCVAYEGVLAAWCSVWVCAWCNVRGV